VTLKIHKIDKEHGSINLVSNAGFVNTLNGDFTDAAFRWILFAFVQIHSAVKIKLGTHSEIRMIHTVRITFG